MILYTAFNMYNKVCNIKHLKWEWVLKSRICSQEIICLWFEPVSWYCK